MKKILHKIRYSQAGMSLIEIMVVLAIIGSVAAIVTVNVLDSLDESKVETTKITIKTLESALENYKRKMGSYPTTEQGLDALVEAPAGLPEGKKYPKKGFLKGDKIPKDAWGNNFEYASPGASGDFEITSLGADGAEGGDDYDADISNVDSKGEEEE